jgi:hypothetical protein
MKSKQLHPWRKVKWAAITALATTIIFSGCKKDVQQEKIAESELQKFEKPVSKKNPFSYTNIQKAKASIAARHNDPGQSNAGRAGVIDPNRVYSYIKFYPNRLTGDMLKQLEADSSIQILDFPFANGELYNDEFALDEVKAKQLADGMLYAVVKKSTSTETTLKSEPSLNSIVLDELYLPEEEDTALQFQALREAGYTEEQLLRIRICLFKRPSGFVRYLDQETGGLVNVPGMQVWGLVFGIPLHTYTDDNGYYRFPWRFSVGTIMGTHAKNPRVNIKPLNTQGAWWLTIPLQFIVGSVHIHGWVTSCQMRDDVNFEFTTHRQNRYWAQLMHAVSLHDQYASNDRIQSAPWGLTMYAHWDDNYGDASAPMLGHISVTAAIIEGVINNIFGGNINLPTEFPNLFNLLTGLLPDITIKTGDFERRLYSSILMQTALHELGHGSHFQRTGHQYWIDYIRATLRRHPEDECGGGYGCGQNPDDGNVAIGESWAEFIGTNHALRNHPNGQKGSRWLGFTLTGTFTPFAIRFAEALEREAWFFNTWISTGVYHDLMDVVNTWPLEDGWDLTGGLTIQQLYEALGPNIDFFCDYEWEIINRYGLNIVDVDQIFQNNGAGGCL